MGFRMNVCRGIDRNNYKYWRGNDHKLYGYYAFKDVAKSFVYISEFMKEQWEEFKDETYDDPRDRYDYICYVGATNDVVLSEEAFKKFSSLYLADVAVLITYKIWGGAIYLGGEPFISVIKNYTGEKAIELYSELSGKTIEEIEKEAGNERPA